jgi:hypothetical protein
MRTYAVPGLAMIAGIGLGAAHALHAQTNPPYIKSRKST